MSVQSEIARITELKGRLRTKLLSIGLLSNQSATLEDCVEAIENFQVIVEDDTTGEKYKIGVDDGELYIQKVESGSALNLDFGVDNGLLYT